MEEIFEVVDKLFTNPPMYRLKDLKGELIEGSFYEQELQWVSKKAIPHNNEFVSAGWKIQAPLHMCCLQPESVRKVDFCLQSSPETERSHRYGV